MKTFIALLRGINVGGTGLLPMKELTALCATLWFESIRTYIQSGNVIFESNLAEEEVGPHLEQALHRKMGKAIHVMVRTPREMAAVLQANPFLSEEPAKVTVLFLKQAAPHGFGKDAVAPGGEQVHANEREIYVYYPDGMGKSKLKLPLQGVSTTARNINTVAKLVAISSPHEPRA